ncbi:MAG: ribonuclease R, partial [Chitinophagaceae bacterium]|nr:ribonuclease R [Chitinophagaceae bacterium]
MPGKKPFKGKKHQSGAKARVSTGVLDITKSGMGFVVVQGQENDVMVRPSDFNTALHGDTVRVLIKGDYKRSRQQGEIIEVLKRRQLEFPGRLQLSNNFAFFIADVDKPMPDIFIPLDKTANATEDDMVIVKIVEWQKNKKPVGEVVQIMDQSDESDFAMKQILMENGFPLQFSDDAIEESERIPDTIPHNEIQSRRDIRGIFT